MLLKKNKKLNKQIIKEVNVMEYIIEPNGELLDAIYGGCINPDCDDLGPTGHCSPDTN